MTMGDRIRQCRKEAGMTQKELAQRLGVQEAAVSKWEKGVVENISRRAIKHMAKLFDVDPPYLMAFSNKRHPDDPEAIKEAAARSVLASVESEFGWEAAEVLRSLRLLNSDGIQVALKVVRALTYSQETSSKNPDPP